MIEVLAGNVRRGQFVVYRDKEWVSLGKLEFMNRSGQIVTLKRDDVVEM